MKKRAKDAPKKRLTLQKETVKELSEDELGGVAGGLLDGPVASGPAVLKANSDPRQCTAVCARIYSQAGAPCKI